MHRLDVGTSGLMVVAKSERGVRGLKRAFHDRAVDKVYHAVVQGHPDPSSRHDRRADRQTPEPDWKFAVTAEGKDAVTHYETLEAMRAASCSRSTWRPGGPTRSACTWPPCGTRASATLYGADPVLADAARAQPGSGCTRSGWVRHPGTGERVEFETRYPADLEHALDVLRAD